MARSALRQLGAIPPPAALVLIALAAVAELYALGPYLATERAVAGRSLAFVQAGCAGVAALTAIWTLLGRSTPEQRESAGYGWAVAIAATLAWIAIYLARRAAVG